MKRLWILLLAVPLTAQIVPDEYILELESPPAALSRKVEDARRLAAEQRDARAAVRELGGQVLAEVDTVANALVVRAAGSRPEALAGIPGVKRVHPVRLYKRLLDHALPLHEVPAAWAQVGGPEKAGAGIKIAILDTGIDATHPGFQAPEMAPPPGFPRANRDADLSSTNGKIIVARAYPDTGQNDTPKDDEGHGTSVAMAAAGVPNEGPFGRITGVAPAAWLGIYKVFPSGGSKAPSSIILKAIDDAVKDGMDVMNLSLGTILASRPSEDILAAAVETAASAGLIVVAAVGNDGPNPNTIGSPGTAPSAIGVGNSYNDRVFASPVVLEGVKTYASVPGNGPNSREPITAQLRDVADLDVTGFACEPLPRRSLEGRIALILRGECYFEVKLGVAASAGAVAAVVYTDEARPEATGMAVGQSLLPATMVSWADGTEIKQRVKENPEQTATLRFEREAVPSNPDRIEEGSSRGPSADGGIKPDLAATGASVSTAFAGTGESRYVVESGTSIAAPLVAGAAAVLKAARPGLTMQQYRSLLVNSSSRMPAGSGQTAGVQLAGAGRLNLDLALRSTVAARPVSLSFGTGGSTVDRSRELILWNLGRQADEFSLAVEPLGPGPAPTAAVAALNLEPGRSGSLRMLFTASSLEPGTYQGHLLIRGARSDVEARIPYWLAVPSTTPRHLTVLYAPESGAPGSRQRIYFRVTEASGVPLLEPMPKATATEGSGRVELIQSIDADIPGAFEAVVRLGSSGARNTFRLEAGSLTQEVLITATSP